MRAVSEKGRFAREVFYFLQVLSINAFWDSALEFV